jgi:type I restriction enzyme S subunit
MSKLPTSWIAAPVGDFTIDSDQRIPSDTEEFKYIDIGSIDRETKKITNPQVLLGKDAPSRARKHVRAGDVLVSMTRPNLNAVAYVTDDLDGQIASTGFDVLRAPDIDTRWPFYLVRSASFVEAMTDLVQGALYPAVRSKDVRGFVAPLAPLPEQTRIADKLDAVLARVDACRDRLDRVPGILKRFRQSVLAAATSGKLTEDWRADQVARMQPQAESGNVARDAAELHYQVTPTPDSAALHPGYGTQQLSDPVSVLLGDHCDVLGGKRLPKGFELTVEDTGFPYVRVTDFAAFSVKVGQLKFIPIEAAPSIQRYIIKSDDIYISIAGSIGLVGQVPQQLSGSNLTENAARIVIRNDFVPRFLMYQLASPTLQDQMNAKKIATTQDKLGLFRIKEFVLLKPSVEEQTEIVRRVESLFAYADRLEARYQTARAQVEKLTPALLAKAFRGELVPQDPNDEPASALLERIRCQHAAAPRPTKRVRKANTL